jgi:serine protease Do
MSNRAWWVTLAALLAALIIVFILTGGARQSGQSGHARVPQTLLLDSLRSERDRLATLVAAGCTSMDLRAQGSAFNAYRRIPQLSGPLPVTPTDGQARAPEQLAAVLDAAVVLIIGKQSHGSGFFIAPDLIVTNSHVVENAGTDGVWVTSRTLGKTYQARVVASTPSSTVGGPDFALLRLPLTAGGMALAIADDATRLAPVVAAGYPGLVVRTDPRLARLLNGQGGEAPETVLSPGEVSVTQPQANGIKLVIHTADISAGNSGGPLVDRCARVVGVNTFVSKSSDYAGRVLYALSAADLAMFLRANDAQFTAATEHCAGGVIR